MKSLEYYKTHRVAIRFNSKEEHKILLSAFSQADSAIHESGVCAFAYYNNNHPNDSIRTTYTCEPGGTKICWYEKHKYEIINTSEFINDLPFILAIQQIREEIGL